MRGTSEKVADCSYEEIIRRYRTPEGVVVDRGVDKKWTDLLQK